MDSARGVHAAPAVLVYCRVWFGAGHWFRIAALMQALTARFRVVCAVDGALTPGLRVPDGVEIVEVPSLAPNSDGALAAVQRRVEALLSILHRVQPDILVLEYFPFGRREVTFELVKLLHAARTVSPRPTLTVCSLRDIQQRTRPDQPRFDREAATMVNRYFDAVLVHADPRFVRFDETFAEAARVTVAVHHTGFVAPPDEAADDGAREPVVLVSAGGGRGGEALLFAAVNAQRQSDLSRDFSMRVIAGTLLPDDAWSQLQAAARDCPRLELARWVPSLRRELARAAVSVSRCGYNTTLDLIRSRVPALVVPYATPSEDEQTNRAERLERAGLARMVPERLCEDPATLAEEIRRTARFAPRASTLDFGGGARSVALLEAMLLERRHASAS
jgi:predicted glycosyltransferase